MSVCVFVYGTLRRGFPNHDVLKGLRARWLGVARTAQALPLVVPRERICTNPGCRFIHQMGVLCDRPGEGQRVEGDLFEVDDLALQSMDRLENYDPKNPGSSTYRRRSIEVEGPSGESRMAECYFAADASPYLALLESGKADAVPSYSLEMSRGELKACCRTDPGHDPPHHVIALPSQPAPGEE